MVAKVEAALNERRPDACKYITVERFDLGNAPPSVELLEVLEMSEDGFKGTFSVQFKGDDVW